MLDIYIKEHYQDDFADKHELNIKEEHIDKESSLYWSKQKITYNAAYGDNETIIAYLFLPKSADPPYQPVIFFPGAGALIRDSSNQLAAYQMVEFIVMSGRAVLYPVYKGTYERKFPNGAPIQEGNFKNRNYNVTPVENRDWTIQMTKDLRRSVDYLMTRDDMDKEKLTYCGMSWGVIVAPIMLAVEDRIKFAVLASGGFVWVESLPAADPVNFAPRVRCDVLMINGEHDTTFPLKTSQEPMYKLLGSKKKELKTFPGGHGYRNFGAGREADNYILKWMDDHLGNVD